MISVALPAAAIINEASDTTSEVTIIACNELQQVCRNLADCCKDRQTSQELHALLDASNQDVDCDALLRALEQCIAAGWEQQEQDTLRMLEENYKLLADIHAQLLEQLGTKARIKIKFFAKLYADELVVTNNMVVDGALVVNNCMRMPNITSDLILANNGGCVIGETIQEIEIPDDSITTADLADGSVTTPKFADGAVTDEKITAGAVTGGVGGKIALATITNANIAAGTITGGTGSGNIAAATVTGGTGGNIAAGTITGSNINSSTITQANLAFNTAQAIAESTALRLIRGSISTSGGTSSILSGAGFTATTFLNPGIFTVTFTTPYTSADSYSLFIRPLFVGPSSSGFLIGGYYIIIAKTANSFRVGFYDNTGSPGGEENPIGYDFFTIGT